MSRTHGRVATYRAGCRCAECKTAHAAAHADWRARRGPKLRRGSHGTLYGYRVLGCRCPRCREAARLYQRELRARSSDGD